MAAPPNRYGSAGLTTNPAVVAALDAQVSDCTVIITQFNTISKDRGLPPGLVDTFSDRFEALRANLEIIRDATQANWPV